MWAVRLILISLTRVRCQLHADQSNSPDVRGYRNDVSCHPERQVQLTSQGGTGGKKTRIVLVNSLLSEAQSCESVRVAWWDHTHTPSPGPVGLEVFG